MFPSLVQVRNILQAVNTEIGLTTNTRFPLTEFTTFPQNTRNREIVWQIAVAEVVWSWVEKYCQKISTFRTTYTIDSRENVSRKRDLLSSSQKSGTTNTSRRSLFPHYHKTEYLNSNEISFYISAKFRHLMRARITLDISEESDKGSSERTPSWHYLSLFNKELHNAKHSCSKVFTESHSSHKNTTNSPKFTKHRQRERERTSADNRHKKANREHDLVGMEDIDEWSFISSKIWMLIALFGWIQIHHHPAPTVKP